MQIQIVGSNDTLGQWLHFFQYWIQNFHSHLLFNVEKMEKKVEPWFYAILLCMSSH